MNYNEYNYKIDLSDELYEKTLSRVKSAVSKHNQVLKRRKTALLSAAACFVVLVCSVSAVKYNNANKLETTVNTPTENTNSDSNIEIITYELKYPHKIIIGNKIYSQYYFGDVKADRNNSIELKQSDIGEFICQFDYFNLTDDLSNFEPISSEEAKTNKFYKAKAYKYAKAKSDNIIIVQAKDEYYIFYLNGLTNDYTVKELLNEYTANGTNEIVGIEIWQNELYDYKSELPEGENISEQDIRLLLIGIIKDKETVNSILTILNNNSELSCTDDFSNEYDKALKKYYDSGLINDYPLMEEYGIYELKIKFSDGNELISDRFSLDVFLQKDGFCFSLCDKEQTTYYFLETTDYDKLTELIKSSL